VEVAHPLIVAEYGESFLEHADFMVGSPTVFADAGVELRLRKSAKNSVGHGCYIPSGALWGAQDIEKMASRRTISALTITMKKHPLSLKVEPPLTDLLQSYLKSEATDEFILYEGSVRELCPLAPNNVNTMACAALAAHNLGFDKVKARLVADKKLEAHVINIDVWGPQKGENSTFYVQTTRFNPAPTGAVTGTATYASFVSSMLAASARGSGVHFC